MESNSPGRPVRRRHEWKRTPIEKRTAAVASLRDLDVPPVRIRSVLPEILVVSLFLHLCLLPIIIKMSISADPMRLAEASGAYLRTVIQKERARMVAEKVGERSAREQEYESVEGGKSFQLWHGDPRDVIQLNAPKK